MDGHFSYLFVVKICNVCLKRPKINEKRPGLAIFLKKGKKAICVGVWLNMSKKSRLDFKKCLFKNSHVMLKSNKRAPGSGH